MADVKSPANPLFLREEELRQGIEMLFFAYRDFTGEPDAMLARIGLGRAHHRVVYFVGRNPGITVSELLAILKITKQTKRIAYYCTNIDSKFIPIHIQIKCSDIRSITFVDLIIAVVVVVG